MGWTAILTRGLGRRPSTVFLTIARYRFPGGDGLLTEGEAVAGLPRAQAAGPRWVSNGTWGLHV